MSLVCCSAIDVAIVLT